MPQVIVVDEIGTELEADAARTIAQRGVQLIATCHGHELQNVMKNPALVSLVGGIQSVTLGDEEARRRGRGSKSVLERQAPPTFSVAVEMLSIGVWRVHTDVASAVDSLLQGAEPATQLRRLGRNAQILVEEELTAGPPQLQAGPAAPLLSSAVSEPPAAPLLRLFCNGIDTEALSRVIAALGLRASVCLAASVDDADCVLALRSRLGRAGADDWLRVSARARGIPVYAIKTDTLSQLVRALKTIVGGEGPAQASSSRGGSEDEAEALEEARLAVEQVVLPRGTAVELLPRAPHILLAQQQLVERLYHLTTETGNSPNGARLRILPTYEQQQHRVAR